MEKNIQQTTLDPNPPTTTPPEPSSLEKKQHPRYLLPVIVIFIVCIIAALIYKNNIHKKSLPQKTSQKNTTQIPFSTPVPFEYKPQDIASWQTLKDDTLGVKVKFPKEWNEASQKYTSPGDMMLTNFSYKEIWGLTTNNTEKEQKRLDINLRAIDNNQQIDKWFENFFKDYPLPDIQEQKLVLLNNIQVVKVTNKRKWTDSYNKTHEETLDRYFIPNKKRVLEVSSSRGNPQDVQIYENILANLTTYDPPIINGTYKTSTDNVFPQPIRDSQIYEERLWDQHNYIHAPRGNVESGELIFYSLNGDVYLISKALEEKLKQITGILKNPKGKDIVFISSIDKAAWASPEGCINRYSTLNLKTGELIEFYKDIPSTNDSTTCRKSVVGIQGSKLIVLGEPAKNSPGPCTNTWVNYKDKFLFLELADIKSGLQKFTVPESKINQEQQEQAKCQNDMFSQQ